MQFMLVTTNSNVIDKIIVKNLFAICFYFKKKG